MKQIALVSLVVFAVGTPSLGYTQMCFNGKPLPECKTFWATEFTYGNQADGNISRGHLFAPELGLMVNLKSKHAVGGSCYIEFLHESDWGESVRFGLKGRYRYWLNRNFNIDAAGGLTISSPWVSLVEAHVFFQNWIGAGGRFEYWSEDRYRGSDTAFYGTLKVGSWPGMSLTTVFAGLLAVLWVSITAAG